MKGLRELHASGSGQFSCEGLQAILDKIGEYHVVVVDLRQESHGFLNGMGITWYCPKNWINKGKTRQEIEKEENDLLEGLLQEQQHILYQKTPRSHDTLESIFPLKVPVLEVMSEEALCKKANSGYFRIPVTNHMRPSDDEVSRFVEFVRSLPPLTWLHFHCSAGEGRTSTFLVMYDILQNAKDLPFHDILKRHSLLGGSDFLAPPNYRHWKHPLKEEKKAFLLQFYKSCRKAH